MSCREANMRFAEVVHSFVEAGDMVWVQDYHCKFTFRASLSRCLTFSRALSQ